MKHPRCQELSNEYNTHSAQGYKRFRVIKENITLKNLFAGNLVEPRAETRDMQEGFAVSYLA